MSKKYNTKPVEGLRPFNFNGHTYRIVTSDDNSKVGEDRYYIEDENGDIPDNVKGTIREYLKSIDDHFADSKKKIRKIDFIKYLIKKLS